MINSQDLSEIKTVGYLEMKIEYYKIKELKMMTFLAQVKKILKRKLGLKEYI